MRIDFRGYERFSMCRRKNFQQKEIADELLEQIHGVIPSNITYDESVRELFMFLAKVFLFLESCRLKKKKNNQIYFQFWSHRKQLPP